MLLKYDASCSILFSFDLLCILDSMVLRYKIDDYNEVNSVSKLFFIKFTILDIDIGKNLILSVQ